jgi:hypothetical protein
MTGSEVSPGEEKRELGSFGEEVSPDEDKRELGSREEERGGVKKASTSLGINRAA